MHIPHRTKYIQDAHSTPYKVHTRCTFAQMPIEKNRNQGKICSLSLITQQVNVDFLRGT